MTQRIGASGQGKIAKRYARALFELTDPSELEARRDALFELASSISSNAQLRQALINPGVTPNQKVDVIRDIARLVRPSDVVLANFVATLTLNGRITALESVHQAFAEMIAAFMRSLELEVVSALPLDEVDKRALEQEIRGRVPQTVASMVRIGWDTDPSLLGGMVIRAGDSVLDSSLSGSLDRIARSIS